MTLKDDVLVSGSEMMECMKLVGVGGMLASIRHKTGFVMHSMVRIDR